LDCIEGILERLDPLVALVSLFGISQTPPHVHVLFLIVFVQQRKEHRILVIWGTNLVD
jgi:hypothetical protein